MLYIHRLEQLNPRGADLESVYLCREIRQRNPFPFTDARMESHFGDFFVSEMDIDAMTNALELINPTLEMVEAIQTAANPIHEAINVKRTVQLLKNAPEPLLKNILFAKDINEWQASVISKVTGILNAIPKTKIQEEKLKLNQELNEVFQKLLRNNDFRFNFYDLVAEGPLSEITGLHESMNKGYLFHYSLEEELKKVSFDEIKYRIPPDKMEEFNKIQSNILLIKKGMERAYDLNMRMIQWAVALYSYVKIAMNP